MSKSRAKRKYPVLFDHFAVVEHWRRTLVDDLNRVRPIAQKEWDYFKKAQNESALKKYPAASVNGASDRKKAAIDKFLSTVNHLTNSVASFTFPKDEALRVRSKIEPQDLLLLRARAICKQILNSLDLEEWFDACKHGPGTSLGVSYCDSGNSAKFQVPWSSTEDAASLFVEYLRYDGHLLREFRYVVKDFLHPEDVWKNVEIVQESRLTTVPKNEKTDRTIAIEPTLNMFFQQGLGSVIAKRLSAFGVDIQVQQEVHRKMAWESSITRKFSTIDFSSASDCVSVDLLRFLLPESWFNAVDEIRCKSVLIQGEVVTLPCIATMGNATTFVLETLVFFALGLASIMSNYKSRTLFPEWEDFKSLSVFGDDCIIPTEVTDTFIGVCRTMGFIVNDEKSFAGTHEPFRESCGADYFGGYNVRPIFANGPRSTKPSNLRAWLYTLWNQTLKRLITSLGSETYVYASSLQFLAELICRHNIEFLVVDDNDPEDAGIKTFGDWVRLKRLFRVGKRSNGMLDRNGTLKYKSLVSAPPLVGIFTPELEYWFKLKFPTVVDPFDPPRPSSFPSRKVDRGYVVRWSSSFSEDLMGVYTTH